MVFYKDYLIRWSKLKSISQINVSLYGVPKWNILCENALCRRKLTEEGETPKPYLLFEFSKSSVVRQLWRHMLTWNLGKTLKNHLNGFHFWRDNLFYLYSVLRAILTSDLKEGSYPNLSRSTREIIKNTRS